MPQLPLFGDAPQTHLTARSRSAGEAPIARSDRPQNRSPRPPAHRSKQISLTESIARHSIPDTRHPIESPAPAIAPETTPAESIAIASPPAKELPPGWVDPSDPIFNYIKNCRLCGAPIKIGGLDHSLCSADCGWVVDLQWLAWTEAHRRKRKEPEPQAATHTDSGDSEALDLFSNGLDRDTSELDGGVA